MGFWPGAGDVAPLNLDICVCGRGEQVKKFDFLKLKKSNNKKQYLLLKTIFKINFALSILGGGGEAPPPPPP